MIESDHGEETGRVAGTGDPDVDRELEALRDVADLPLVEQVAVFERVQAALQDRLVDADG